MKQNIQPTRIFLVDDHPAVRHGLALVLERGHFTICAEADSVAHALARLADLETDLAVVDLTFSEGSGFDLITALSAHGIPVLVYSMHEDAESIEHSFRAGADGYVSKREDAGILLHGVREVLDGKCYIGPHAVQALGKKRITSDVEKSESRCSPRELQLLDLLGQGLGNSEIAACLSISVRTVETYCTRINEKLELSGMKALRQFAVRNRPK